MKSTAQLDLISRALNARTFLLFLREWFPYGTDIVVLTNDRSGECRRSCMASGESSKPIEARVIYDGLIPEAEFQDFVERIDKLGAVDLPKDYPRISTGHCTDHYLLSLPNGKQRQIRVPGSDSDDPRISQLENLFVDKPLADFYRK